jgi:Trp operon repressor
MLCYKKAQSYRRIKVSRRDSSEQIHTPIATPTKGANAMKKIPNIHSF